MVPSYISKYVYNVYKSPTSTIVSGGDIQYERRMGLDFIISYSENNMLFIFAR